MTHNFTEAARTIGFVVPPARHIEKQLRQLGYLGTGLHQLANSAHGDFDADVIRAIRKIATIRNKASHEDDFLMSGHDKEGFLETFHFVDGELQARIDLRARKGGVDPEQRLKQQKDTIANWVIAGIALVGLLVWHLH
ncbi:hypothetical protein [Paraburkholderia sp. J8-2]|uniref:hypothetical protein n=1 Tax=Paraburkholderia sp. J8-2 TaxID=2805440 RepID=UPI002AB6FAFE|nr:hypothetical protein [Paraburkholderia sp. J8-2]